jgi:hypothetical protein
MDGMRIGTLLDRPLDSYTEGVDPVSFLDSQLTYGRLSLAICIPSFNDVGYIIENCAFPEYDTFVHHTNQDLALVREPWSHCYRVEGAMQRYFIIQNEFERRD